MPKDFQLPEQGLNSQFWKCFVINISFISAPIHLAAASLALKWSDWQFASFNESALITQFLACQYHNYNLLLMPFLFKFYITTTLAIFKLYFPSVLIMNCCCCPINSFHNYCVEYKYLYRCSFQQILRSESYVKSSSQSAWCTNNHDCWNFYCNLSM